MGQRTDGKAGQWRCGIPAAADAWSKKHSGDRPSSSDAGPGLRIAPDVPNPEAPSPAWPSRDFHS